MAIAHVHPLKSRRPARGRTLAICAVALFAMTSAGCAKRSPSMTGSIDARAPQAMTEAGARQQAEGLAQRNAANPHDADVAIAYAAALRRIDQRAQAVAVLQQAAIQNGTNLELMGAYGRALADVGRFEEAERVLARAHLPERPDWRILSAQGTVADQLGDSVRARQYYQAALRLQPGEPSVMSNLGLSLALGGELDEAEKTLREAVEHPRADQRVRQNLALVYGLQGKFREAETTLARDLPPAEVQTSMTAIRGMVSQQNSWSAIRQSDAGEATARRRD
jgi:Flp pilus assembly protein TadD